MASPSTQTVEVPQRKPVETAPKPQSKPFTVKIQNVIPA
jgi:hypothetical protein